MAARIRPAVTGAVGLQWRIGWFGGGAGGAAEALTNVVKHSGATAATLTAHQRGDMLTVAVVDNGRGGADPESGTGLVGLGDRIAVSNGRMLLSSPVGGPTVIQVELPCTPAPSA